MLGKNKIIAFVPTNNPTGARKFYEEILGLRFVSDDQFALVMDANGIMVRIAKSSEGFKPAPHTILGWEVPKHSKRSDGAEGKESSVHALRFLATR